MPIQREHVQFALIFLSVPLQLFLTNYMGSNEASRTYAISKIVTQLSELRESWFRLDPWRAWCMDIIKLQLRINLHWNDELAEDPNGESPAIEVFKYRDKNGYFGQSPEPRDTRPPHVKYRVGQVIKHIRWGYRGVIIGWDETARAPDVWIKEMHNENREWSRQPNYAILVDTRDRPAPQITYVPQENLDVVKHTKVLHPSVHDYFENFDGSQYLPRPWLRSIYRRD